MPAQCSSTVQRGDKGVECNYSYVCGVVRCVYICEVQLVFGPFSMGSPVLTTFGSRKVVFVGGKVFCRQIDKTTFCQTKIALVDKIACVKTKFTFVHLHNITTTWQHLWHKL